MKIIELKSVFDLSDLFGHLAKKPYAFFLDSSDKKGFSFIGAFPYKTVTSLEDLESELCQREGEVQKILKNNQDLSHIPFLGGAVGFISYDAVRQWETHLNPSRNHAQVCPPITFGFYDTFLAHDHTLEKTYLICLELTPDSSSKYSEFLRYVSTGPAAEGLSPLSSPAGCGQRRPLLRRHPSKESLFENQSHPSKKKVLCSNISYEQYCTRVVRAKEYIRLGEIYQVNLSQCFSAELPCSPDTLYQTLRVKNPAPFSAYLNFGEIQILSSSPERFVRVDLDGWIQTEPIKGTVPRGKTPNEDDQLKQELLTSEKNRAELMMIVDLERNDLGKICRFGSVSVPTLYELRSFTSIHHLVSVIRGQLSTRNIQDLIQAIFPGGSITGAPKLRAMQIIDELESDPRGIYTGSIGYIDYRRQIDLNIAIRTIVHQQGKVYFSVGGGIVCDSNPHDEFEETLHKGKALIESVRSIHEQSAL